jgi:hypothetical protein
MWSTMSVDTGAITDLHPKVTSRAAQNVRPFSWTESGLLTEGATAAAPTIGADGLHIGDFGFMPHSESSP